MFLQLYENDSHAKEKGKALIIAQSEFGLCGQTLFNCDFID